MQDFDKTSPVASPNMDEEVSPTLVQKLMQDYESKQQEKLFHFQYTEGEDLAEYRKKLGFGDIPTIFVSPSEEAEAVVESTDTPTASAPEVEEPQQPVEQRPIVTPLPLHTMTRTDSQSGLTRSDSQQGLTRSDSQKGITRADSQHGIARTESQRAIAPPTHDIEVCRMKALRILK